MPVTNWWTVDDALMRIITGPFLWDGSSDWSPPAGQRVVDHDPTVDGYSWTPSPVIPPDTTMATTMSRIAALEARLFNEARGVKAVPNVTLILGGTTTVRVTLRTAMPNTNFTPYPLLIGGTQIGNLSIASAAVVDRQNVDVVVRAGLALTISGVNILVFADAN